MRNVLLALLGVTIGVVVVMAGLVLYERAFIPSQEPGELPLLQANQSLVTVNTTRVGSDDPLETAVAVSNMIYPATEEENTPGAVILVNRDNLAEVLVAASRFQHHPVDAPLLYVDQNSLPEITRNELLRLQPEGVPVDGNVQVYIVGTIGDNVVDEVEEMGYKTRVVRADTPVDLAVLADDWTATQHGDHRNEVAIVNLDRLEEGVPSAFWNAHRGDGLAFVTDQGVPEATREMLRRRANGPWLYLFGDESVIPPSVARDLAQLGHVTRINAPDAPGTSAFFAAFRDEGEDWGAWFWQAARTFGWGISEAGHNAIFVRLDGPAGWQNAIVATTLSHMGKHAPVLILEGDTIPEPVTAYLATIRPYETAPRQQLLNHGLIIGGENTISWETQAQIDLLLEAYPSRQVGAVAADGGE
ncbi:MAG TPA: cell wall-binding repeat 2 family protein [Anaerolineae bacterium]|nr:cell wall-binding repeat 2 family protein [Anaerolineae bacterium]